MRRSVTLAVLAALVLLALLAVTAVQAQGVTKAPARHSGGGGVQPGRNPNRRRRDPSKPDLRQSAADGSRLAPYDPFHIARRHERRQARKQAKKQELVNAQTRFEYCQAAKARADRRRAVAAAERAQEAKERAAEQAARAAAARADENSLLEVESEDAVIAAENAEEAADEQQEQEDLAEMEQDIMNGSDMDSDIGNEADADAEAEAEADRKGRKGRKGRKSRRSRRSRRRSRRSRRSGRKGRARGHGLRPTARISYSDPTFSQQHFSNKDGHAVFHRRRVAKTAVRFGKNSKSDGGVAHVKGVTKLPCGREVTDKGLFQPVVSSNPGRTVAAAQPQPDFIDQNIIALKHLPVVPELRVKEKDIYEN